MALPLNAYVSDEELFATTLAFIEARDKFNQLKEMRRLWANHQRVEANKVDDDTNLGIEEVNEVLPIPVDYEPVEPALAPVETLPGD